MLNMDNSGIHLWLVIWKAYEALQAHATRSIKDLGMCYSDFAVLECLLHKGPTPVNTIGELVSLTSGSITTAVDRLEHRGLVERRNSELDRRTRLVNLTSEGRTLIKQAFAKHEQDMERVAAASLTSAERHTLLKLVKKFGKGAAAMEDTDD